MAIRTTKRNGGTAHRYGDLGDMTTACIVKPSTCATSGPSQGGSVSFWVKMIQDSQGLLSSVTSASGQGTGEGFLIISRGSV